MRKTVLSVMLCSWLSGCSQLSVLDTETRLLGGAMAAAAVVEATGNDNYGVTHGIISFGISHAAETFADEAFPAPEQEWAADTITIIGAAVPAAYYTQKESGNNTDSQADFLFPVGNLLAVLWRRLSREQ